MQKSSVFGLALCLSVAATTCMAANDGTGGNVGPQRVTGTQTDSQQLANPATAGAGTVTTNQANGTYPATVGPTGSTQPDATNPNRNQPAGGGARSGGGERSCQRSSVARDDSLN